MKTRLNNGTVTVEPSDGGLHLRDHAQDYAHVFIDRNECLELLRYMILNLPLCNREYTARLQQDLDNMVGNGKADRIERHALMMETLCRLDETLKPLDKSFFQSLNPNQQP